MSPTTWRTLALLSFCLTLPLSELHAETPADPVVQAQAEIDAANSAAMLAAISGPSDIVVADQAHLQLPDGMAYVPRTQTQRLLKSFDGQGDDTVQGMVIPTSEEEQWMLLVSYKPAGYIKDDDAKSWDPDQMLTNLREGTEAANTERKARGIAELEVVGWAEVPVYTASDHHLRWSASAREKGAEDPNYTINYNTLALGREGYISMNLVTDAQNVQRLKPVAGQLMGALKFDAGKNYSDFEASTDKVAEYGLAALVAGVAAKKLGFFALAAAFVLKFAKVFLIALAGGATVIGRLFKRKKE
jgi:uncharacterized membrane-anchored protein